MIDFLQILSISENYNSSQFLDLRPSNSSEPTKAAKKKIVIQYERIARVQIKNSIRNAYGVLYFDNVETPYYYHHCHCRRGARYTMSLEILHMVQIKL